MPQDPLAGVAKTHPTARALATSTPAARNRYVDLLRVVSIGVVVLGHWLMAVITWRDGKFVGENVLELAPWFQVLTWVFQVMPVFFIVGGYSNAASWESARRRGLGYPDWLRGRFARILRPTVVFVGVWTLGSTLARVADVEPDLVRVGGVVVSLPLWFLAVYALILAAAPLALAAHKRFGVRAALALVTAAGLVDLASWGFDVPIVGWSNFVFVWLAVHQLGFLWRDGVLTSRRWLPWILAGGGLATLTVLVVLGPYPASMIELERADSSNSLPPSLALVALGIWEAGLVLLFQRVANRWLARPRAWTPVVAMNAIVMTVYLWHMTALVLAALAIYPTGLFPEPSPLSTGWWALRPPWVVACAVILVPLVVLFRRAERHGVSAPPAPPGLRGLAAAAAGTLGACAGLAVLALQGFYVPHAPGGLPIVGLGCLAVGIVLHQSFLLRRAAEPRP